MKFKINRIKVSLLLFFLPFLTIGSVLFARASIIDSIRNLFSASDTASNTEKTNLSSSDLLKPTLASIIVSESQATNKKNKETVSEDSSEIEIREDGILVVQSGPMRLSTEKEKPINDTISLYEVKEGDSLVSVAQLFGVSKNTIVWANNLKSNKIVKGDVLLIFPMSGIQYTLKSSGTIRDVAKKYNTDASEVAEYNGIGADTKLTKGQIIFIPDAEGEIEAELSKAEAKAKTTVKVKVVAPKYKNNAIAGYFMRPVSGCVRTQGLHGPYGTAIDFGCPIGTSIAASAGGTVIRSDESGYNGGYGEVIIISHPNGTQTIYSHLSRIDVAAGQKVSQGQIIGATGNTGRSTGPHLHFETRGTSNPF
ncbi:MAG: hypothetical protein RI945_189 [Candidatus Parcubacteria bacterium]|jgi:murein DD-endopeptidase MepM/ murein hydrolase activator NlpD